MTETFYKIRNRKTGLFSRGGMSPRFDKKGKVWKKPGHITSHLNQLSPKSAIYADCDRVTFEVTVVETEALPLASVIAERQEKARKKVEAQKVAAKQAEEQRERAMLKALQTKYGTAGGNP